MTKGSESMGDTVDTGQALPTGMWNREQLGDILKGLMG